MKDFIKNNLVWIVKVLALFIGMTLGCIGVEKLSILMMVWGFILVCLACFVNDVDSGKD